MPVDTPHPEYTKAAGRWQRMRDVVAGQDAVHGATIIYLPKLKDESEARYKARLGRTPFFEATARTVEGLVGMLFRKPLIVECPDALRALLGDVTKSGVSFEALGKGTATEIETVARAGILVDYPEPPEREEGAPPLMQADAEKMNLRPHMARYAAESITYWETAWINNRTMLSKVVLKEMYSEPDPADEFVRKTGDQWRVLDLAEGVYRQRLFRRRGDAGLIEQHGGDVTPQMNNKPLAYIPFQFFGAEGNGPDIEKPPLLAMANINVSHFHTTADLEHGAHQTALPQPWIAGVQPDVGIEGQPVDKTLYIGGGDAWVFPNADTEVGMLEYTGAGLTALETRLASKEAQMAVLGARMLEPQKTGVEAAETAGIHRAGEQATLASQADVLSRGLLNVLTWFAEWAGISGAISVKVNKEFFPLSMTAQEITAVVGAWQNGALSPQEKFEKFQKGGLIRDDKKFDEHETEIANAPPTLLADPAAEDAEP